MMMQQQHYIRFQAQYRSLLMRPVRVCLFLLIVAVPKAAMAATAIIKTAIVVVVVVEVASVVVALVIVLVAAALDTFALPDGGQSHVQSHPRGYH
jgi:hypothetical protein